MNKLVIKNNAEFDQNNLCSRCSRYLNVPPISTIRGEDENEMETICGRCLPSPSEGGNVARQYAYEKLARSFLFPCTNQKHGCKEMLSWNEVPEHEEACSYQDIDCLLSLFPEGNCSWKKNMKELQEHIETEHKDLILNPFEFEWKDSKRNFVFFGYFENKLVVFFSKFKDEKYFCLAFIVADYLESKSYEYQLTFSVANTKRKIGLESQSLYPFGSVLETIKNDEKFLEIDFDKIKLFIQNAENFHCKIEIFKKTEEEILEITQNNCSKLSLIKGKDALCNLAYDELLEELECLVCHEIMRPPILNCDLGHSICNECKNKVAECPTCRGNYSKSRNYTVEKIVSKMQFSDQETEKSESSANNSFLKLIKVCCLFDCRWMGLKSDFYQHLQEEHENNLLQVNTYSIVPFAKAFVKVLYFEGVFFLLKYNVRNESPETTWFSCVHCFCEYDTDINFTYQIHITPDSKHNFILSGDCAKQINTPGLDNEMTAKCIKTSIKYERSSSRYGNVKLLNLLNYKIILTKL